MSASRSAMGSARSCSRSVRHRKPECSGPGPGLPEETPKHTEEAMSNLDVGPLVLGGNTFGWTSDKDESFAVLDKFVAAGGRSIDTADVYSAWIPGNSG